MAQLLCTLPAEAMSHVKCSTDTALKEWTCLAHTQLTVSAKRIINGRSYVYDDLSFLVHAMYIDWSSITPCLGSPATSPSFPAVSVHATSCMEWV